MDRVDNLEAYDTMPAYRAVLKNALPAIVVMLMQMVYNLADTFFVGLTHIDLQVAAVSLTMPVFLIFMSLGTVFGIGGTSVISRALGEGHRDYVKKVSSFCMWAGVATGLALTGTYYLFLDDILKLMGANADVLDYARDYLLIVSACGPMTIIASTFSNILRAEGQPNKAMVGMLLGNLLNIILDPIMIIWLGWGIRGAALATVIGSTVGALYYLLYFRTGTSMLSINPRHFTCRKGVARSVLAIGIPAALGPLLMSVSLVVMNAFLSGHGSLAVAAAGVALRVTMITSMIAMGIGMGIQPLLGYSVGSRNWRRYREYLRTSLLLSLVLCLTLTALCYLFANEIVGVFLTEPDSLRFGVRFTYILLSTSSLFGIFFCYVNALQAMGVAMPSLIVNVSRQGLIFIPALFILGSTLGVDGLIWAQPTADVLALILAVSLHTLAFKKMIRSPTPSKA